MVQCALFETPPGISRIIDIESFPCQNVPMGESGLHMPGKESPEPKE